ncbi:hypothetical protein V1389_11775 [Flavobacterium rakeshii]|uniref:hypothetical protein n=1 Tax=Flavobacterium rakeshii TaxID=1038845 RepID=UPI002E7C1D42|nr:hypothetical protein [Flavobacterium rakeshii]MEE1899021.1 hypothetical protein [Flavobacterium rakeshii]
MRELGNIHLVWRPEKGKARISVGTIKKSATEGITFQYNEKNISLAKDKGFLCYEGFPDTTKKYYENVVDIFGQRLTRSERPDTKDFYDFWHVDTLKKEDKYYMLAFTQGLLPTDNYEFLADFNPKENLTFVSEIAGLTNLKINSNLLRVGDNLRYELDRNNAHDKYAVKVFKENLFLGYIKLIHNRVFYKANKNDIEATLTVQSIEKNGVLNRVFIKVSF